MNCGAPGCPNPPGDQPVRVKARAAVDFEPEPRASALVYLCATHQAEF